MYVHESARWKYLLEVANIIKLVCLRDKEIT